MIESDEIKLPAEFQVAFYENLIQQLERKRGLHVHRAGDRNAAHEPDLVTFHSTVCGFKQGSEEKRQVTTVTGATSITIHCRFTDNQGNVLLEKYVNGKVRFFGDDLKATYDFAKKAAGVVSENFAATRDQSNSTLLVRHHDRVSIQSVGDHISHCQLNRLLRHIRERHLHRFRGLSPRPSKGNMRSCVAVRWPSREKTRFLPVATCCRSCSSLSSEGSLNGLSFLERKI